MPNANQRVGEYVLQDRIAAGTFGEVWRAHHHVWTDQVVAVKIPTDPQYLRNLQREGTAVHGLQHPNVVRAIGFDPYAETPYLAMEYIPGSDLRKLIGNKSLQIADVVAIMRQTLAGLAHAHAKGLVHRDVKPENILIHERAFRDGFAAEGVVKVTDFGLGRAAASTAGSIAYSQSMNTPEAQDIAGTLDYMAPEARSGAGTDARADLYACGVLLYEMLTGERPAGTDLPSDLNPAVPKALDDAFRRSYARLDKRFASADEFAAALGTGATPPALPPLPPRGGGQSAAGGPPRVLAFGQGQTRVDAQTYAAIAAELSKGQKINAIVILREATGLGLAAAKEVVESAANFPSHRPDERGYVPPRPNVAPSAGAGGCPQCRQAVDANDQFCMHCGFQLVENVRRCPQCAAYPDPTDQYCIFCGQVLRSELSNA